MSCGRWHRGRILTQPREHHRPQEDPAHALADGGRRVPVLVNGPQDLQRRRQKQIEMAAMQQHVSKVSHAASLGYRLQLGRCFRCGSRSHVLGDKLSSTPHSSKSMGDRCPNTEPPSPPDQPTRPTLSSRFPNRSSSTPRRLVRRVDHRRHYSKTRRKQDGT